jgi:hypothetical protein
MKRICDTFEEERRFRHITGKSLWSFIDTSIVFAFKDGMCWLNLQKIEQWLGIENKDVSIKQAITERYGNEASDIIKSLIE